MGFSQRSNNILLPPHLDAGIVYKGYVYNFFSHEFAGFSDDTT